MYYTHNPNLTALTTIRESGKAKYAIAYNPACECSIAPRSKLTPVQSKHQTLNQQSRYSSISALFGLRMKLDALDLRGGSKVISNCVIRTKRPRWSRGSVLAFSTQVRGFLRAKKVLSTPSFGGEVKPSVPCRRFAACKRSLNCVEVVTAAKLPDNILAHSSHFRRWDLSRRGGRGGTWW